MQQTCVTHLCEDDATRWGQSLEPQACSLYSKMVPQCPNPVQKYSKILVVCSFSSGTDLFTDPGFKICAICLCTMKRNGQVLSDSFTANSVLHTF